MNLSKKIFFFLSLCVYLTGCKTPYNCGVNNEADTFSFTPIIHLVNDTPVLYSSEFDVMKYRFSGLIAFRRMPEENEIRIVFLSETGLKLMEYNYREGEINNTYCITVADKKQIKKFIGNFLLMLIETHDCQNNCSVNIDGKTIYYCKNNSYKFKTEIVENNRVYDCLAKRNNMACGTYSDIKALPDEIQIKMSHNKIRIDLKRVDNAFK